MESSKPGVVNPAIVRGKPANRPDGGPINRLAPSRNTLMTILSHGSQTSSYKNVSFPYTNAAFTLPPAPMGFAMLCQLAQELSLLCGFCPSSRAFALQRPSDPSSRRRPCLRLVILLVSITMNTSRFSYRGLSPHKFMPMSGVQCAGINRHGVKNERVLH
jgi:hypothetical protein